MLIWKASLLATALMISACSVAQQPIAPNFLSEARSIRTKDPKAPQLDLAHVAQKYIPVGTPKEVALNGMALFVTNTSVF
jgi:hypothetical protein